ncbi:MAG: M56 family metallopeptidase [Bacteroidales bacterium]|nr:M56 family metallopeptidase [Bacteroidales bacterium]
MDLLVYTFRVSLSLAAVFAAYKLFMSRETLHALNRFAILAAVAMSFVLPFAKMPQLSALNEDLTVPEVFIELEGVVVHSGSQQNIGVWNVIATVLVVGSVFFFLRFLVSIISVLFKVFKSKSVNIGNGIKLIIGGKDFAPVSWMRYVFISADDYAGNCDEIIAHETAHIRYGHSFDLIFMDLVCAIQWFNPCVWLFRRELCAVHEFQADQKVVDLGFNAKLYQILLVKKAAGRRWNFVANSLNHSNLKNRITMMTRKKSSKKVAIKALLPVAVSAVFAFTFACCNQSNSLYDAMDANVSTQLSNPQTADQPFVIVENMPEYPGGEKALIDYVTSHVEYPAEAKNDTVMRRTVYLKFVVDKVGKVKDVEVLRSSGNLVFDNSAIKTVESMPEWKPGMQSGKPVDVAIQIPIQFVRSN